MVHAPLTAEIETYAQELRGPLDQLAASLEGLTSAQRAWRPPTGTANSAAVIVSHVVDRGALVERIRHAGLHLGEFRLTRLFGFADAGVMALAISRGAPVIMVANPTPVGANGAITVGWQMNTPKDYEGKKIGLVPGESSHAILQAVLKRYNVPESSYRVIAIEASSKVPALLSGKVDTIPGFRFGDFLRAYTQNADTKIKLFSDWGINALGNGYLVTTKTLAEKPDLVRGFVRATIHGWTDTIADPHAGVDALLAAFPDTNRRFAESGLPLVIEHMHTPATKGKPLGWMAEEDWKATIDLLKTSGLEGDRPLSAYYRNMVE